ncbi:hypothetical protein PR048_013287 [Dryococelus australis]|uniref:Uncharacterized protein n=1 Tax=Dryococelus australis TaxID=614101 RepID=A0ABQ9HRQ6_9NEOP|nr:hypothetical protein PR048_013287 [Dryococelus australis]
MITDGRSSASPTSPPYTDYHHSQHPQAYRQAYKPSALKNQHHGHNTPPASPSSADNTSQCCRLRCCGHLQGKPRRRRRNSTWCCCCYCPSTTATSVFTSLGVCVLVLGYTVLGAFTFMAVEGGLKDSHLSGNNVGTSSLTSSAKVASASKGISDKQIILGEDIRSKTVEKLWSITEDLNILYKDNWTRLAAQEVLKFQDTLVKNLKGHGSGGAVIIRNGGYGSGNGGAIYYNHQHHRWSFSSSFLYSLTLITTIGKLK